MDLPAPRPTGVTLAAFLRRGGWTLAATVVIGPLFAMVFSDNVRVTTVYTLAISMFCWLFIDGGRVLVGRGQPDGWPGWPVMVPILVGGTALGYSAGIELGNLLMGRDAPGILAVQPRRAIGAVLLAMVPGIIVSYWSWSRGRLAATEARAQKAQREAAENQLRLLQSQLEPHMLFNTLANLRVLIASDPDRAQAMLDQLIGFLRATLSASRASTHPLADEFARLADYLALMQVRLGPRLVARFDLPDALAGVPVPPLLLQPLVENSIRHGIEPKLGGGRIVVAAARDGARLCLTVRDTGVGLADTRGNGTNFGLAQVRERLTTLYGAHASLTIADASDAEGGALVTIHLPLERSP